MPGAELVPIYWSVAAGGFVRISDGARTLQNDSMPMNSSRCFMAGPLQLRADNTLSPNRMEFTSRNSHRALASKERIGVFDTHRENQLTGLESSVAAGTMFSPCFVKVSSTRIEMLLPG